MKTLSIYTLLLFLFASNPLLCQKNKEKLYNTNKENIAASGYDIVAYFTQNAPVEGNRDVFSVHQGITYLFLNQENKSLFDQTPEKYIPQYGGWCAYAMGKKGEKVSINPKAFSIEEGKLYLFYKKGGVDTLKRWLKNTAELKSKASTQWSKHLSKSSS
ncbi:MAG: hypothetical protein OXC03_09045 [Flavobacteriaceae bacterium]|nr:hypothetical protein [Flavobacteriaceae bacterium]